MTAPILICRLLYSTVPPSSTAFIFISRILFKNILPCFSCPTLVVHHLHIVCARFLHKPKHLSISNNIIHFQIPFVSLQFTTSYNCSLYLFIHNLANPCLFLYPLYNPTSHHFYFSNPFHSSLALFHKVNSSFGPISYPQQSPSVFYIPYTYPCEAKSFVCLPQPSLFMYCTSKSQNRM